MAAPTRGDSNATPVAKAAALAECPDGNDPDVGDFFSWRPIGMFFSSGRSPPNTFFPTRFASMLAPSSDAEPRMAALGRPNTSNTPAIVNQSAPRFADRDRREQERST